MRKILIILAATLVAISCNRGLEHKVVATYPDGKTMIMQDIRDSVVVGETRYYKNGNIHYQKHYDKSGKAEGEWVFNYPSGERFATASHSAKDDEIQWMIYDRDGAPYYKDDYDSIRVLEIGVGETPATIAYFKGHRETLLQFYSNGTLRSMGDLVEGYRDGVWTFYHMNGQKQTEATFIKGREEGQYTVYYENGVPLYIGHYRNGDRIGIWEFYDDEGNLVQKKEYTKE